MSAPETIARTLAARFAPEIDARLPVAVDRAIAEGSTAESPFLSPDINHVFLFANFVVTVVGLAWNIHMGQWQKAQAGELARTKEENEALRRQLRERLDAEAPRLPGGDESLRARLLEAATDEAIAEAERRRAQR